MRLKKIQLLESKIDSEWKFGCCVIISCGFSENYSQGVRCGAALAA